MGYTRLRTTKAGQDRYTAYYHDIRGRECSAGTFAQKRDADRAWRRAEGRIAEGRFPDVRSGRQTFQRYVEGLWLPHHSMEPTTRQGYAYIVGKHLLPEFGRMRMAEILPTDIRVFLGTLHARGVRLPRCNAAKRSSARSSPPRSPTVSSSCTRVAA